MRKYIHYGHDIFDPALVTVSRPGVSTKPDKGLWASPIDSKWGWKDWCEAEAWSPSGFDWSKSIVFSLSSTAKILEIHNEEDMAPYIVKDKSIFDGINTERLYSEFDGMELFLSENWKLGNEFFSLWDCDSIVVWNPDVLVVHE